MSKVMLEAYCNILQNLWNNGVNPVECRFNLQKLHHRVSGYRLVVTLPNGGGYVISEAPNLDRNDTLLKWVNFGYARKGLPGLD